jgi:hypothetical protein
MARILTYKAWNPLNPSHHQIRDQCHRFEPLNWPRSKRRPQGRRWATSWSRKSAGVAAHYSPSSEEGSRHRKPSWSCSPPCFAPGKHPIDPRIILPQKPHVTVPRRDREQSSSEPPMASPHRACALPPSIGFDVSRLLIDGGPGLDHRYPVVSIKS